MKALLSKLWANIKAHVIAYSSGLGIALLSVDIAGFADTIKTAADRYIPGGKAAQWIGVGLFILIGARAIAFTLLMKKAQALAAAQAIPVTVTVPGGVQAVVPPPLQTGGT